jgi:hypothetical protein
VEIATSQIPELQGVEIPAEAFRTDLALAAVEALEAEGIDMGGGGWEPLTVELREGGN